MKRLLGIFYTAIIFSFSGIAFAQKESPRLQPSDVIIWELAKPDVVFIAGVGNKNQVVNNKKYIQKLAELGNKGAVGKITLITSEGCVLKNNTRYNMPTSVWNLIGIGPALSNTTTWYECPVRVYNPQTKVFEPTFEPTGKPKIYKMGEYSWPQFISNGIETVVDGKTSAKSFSITRQGEDIEAWMNMMKDPDPSALDANGQFRFLYNASEERRKWNEAQQKEKATQLEEQARKMEQQAKELQDQAKKLREQNMQKSLPKILLLPADAEPALPTPLPLPANKKPVLPDPLLFKVK